MGHIVKGGLAVPTRGSSNSNGEHLFLQLDQDEKVEKVKAQRNFKRYSRQSRVFALISFYVFLRFYGVPAFYRVTRNSSTRIRELELEVKTLKTRVSILEVQLKATRTASLATTAPATFSRYNSYKRRSTTIPQTSYTQAPYGSSLRGGGTLSRDTAVPSKYERKKSLGPLEIDLSGLVSDPREAKALDDLQTLLGQPLEVMTTSHASYSNQGIKIYRQQVTQLSIKKHGLTEIPESIRFFTKLEYLSLEKNNLTTLPDVFNDLTSITTVILSDNPLVALPPSLQHPTRPIKLSLEKKKSSLY